MQAIGEYLRSYIGDKVPDMPVGSQQAAMPAAPPATTPTDQPSPQAVQPLSPPRTRAEEVKEHKATQSPLVPQLGYTRSATGRINAHARGRTTDGVAPAAHLKEYRTHSFAGVPFAVAHGRCFFASMKKMTMMGFRCPSDFFSPTQATAKARKKPRKPTHKVITIGTCYIDFKGRFTCSKDGGYTSVLGFKHPLSKHVHEAYVKDQTELTCEREFTNYKNKMRIEFGIHIDECVFDRDPSFNEAFSAFLRVIGVHPDTAGAEDHDRLGPIETYWDVWYTNVTAAMLHAGLDETHWKFAAEVFNHAYNRLPHDGNEGSISPIEWLTYSTPDCSHLRTPFSTCFVTQPKKQQTNMRCKAIKTRHLLRVSEGHERRRVHDVLPRHEVHAKQPPLRNGRILRAAPRRNAGASC